MTLVIFTLFLHSSGLWTEYMSTMICPFLFEALFQRHKIIDMYEDRSTPDQKVLVVEF